MTADGGLWIGSADWRDGAVPVDHRPYAMRGTARLESVPAAALVRLTASPRGVLWLNGVRVWSGPARARPAGIRVDTIDLAPWLRIGDNHLAVLLWPGNGTADYDCATRLGFLLVGDHGLGSDRGWRGRPADWYQHPQRWWSMPSGQPEHLDLAAEPAQWRTAEALDTAWQQVRVLGEAAGTPPWIAPRDRGLPPSHLVSIHPPLVQAARMDRALAAPVDVNAAGWFAAQPRSPLAAPRSLVFTPADGDVVVADLGRTRLHRPRLRITGVRGPLRLECWYGIGVSGVPQAMNGFGSAREGAVDSWDIPAGPACDLDLETTQVRGARWLTVRVAGPGTWDELRIDAEGVEFPFADGARFHAEDPWLQALWDTSRATLASAANPDALVDTCSRENVCWTMDAAVAGLAAFHLTGDLALWRRSLELVAEDIDASGVPRSVVPSDSACTLPDQAMLWAWSVAQHFAMSADDAWAKLQVDPLSRLLAWCEASVTSEDRYVPPSWCWHWVDWAPLEKRAYAAPINALLALAARETHILGAALRSRGLVDQAGKLHQRLTGGFRGFLHDGGTLDHLAPGVPVPFDNNATFHHRGPALAHTLHGHVLAWRAGVAPATILDRAAALLAAKPDVAHCGPGMLALLLTPLCQHGHAATVLDHLRHLTAPIIAAGQPTWPEELRWPQKHNTAHGWGATLATVLVEGVLGLTPALPGWRAIRFTPVSAPTGDLDYELDTPAGTVRVERHGERWTCTPPPGVEVVAD